MGIVIRRRKGIETRISFDEGAVVKISRFPTKVNVGDKLHEIFYEKDGRTQKPKLFIHRQYLDIERYR